MVLKNQDKLICRKVSTFLKPVLDEHGLVLFDVKFKKEKSDRILQVTIDKVGVNVDDCTLVSKALSEWLDEVDIISYDNYSLEVSTPGLERPLYSLEDYTRFLNSFCSVTLKEKEADGRRKYRGVIQSVSGEEITIFVEKENKTFKIDFCNIKKANLEVVF